MDVLRGLCCCLEQVEDDYSGPYERLDEDGSAPVTVVRQRFEAYSNGNSGSDEPDSRRSEDRGPPKSSEEQEADALNQILENTQHNIIDVTHMESLALNTTDYIQRARQYEEAVVAHDTRASKSAHSAPRSPGKPSRRLLEDNGNRAADWLGRPTLPAQQLSEIKELTAKMYEAVSKIQVTHKTDLVVHMQDF